MRTHSLEAETNQPAKRKSILLRILDALHASRRREAIRGFRRYRYLMASEPAIAAVPILDRAHTSPAIGALKDAIRSPTESIPLEPLLPCD